MLLSFSGSMKISQGKEPSVSEVLKVFKKESNLVASPRMHNMYIEQPNVSKLENYKLISLLDHYWLNTSFINKEKQQVTLYKTRVVFCAVEAKDSKNVAVLFQVNKMNI